MSAMAVTGLGAVAGTGFGAAPLAAAARTVAGTPGAPIAEAATVIEDFDVRALLGRRGTMFLDRCTAIALVAAGEALADSGLEPSGGRRIGVSLGTTAGSLRSMSDYTRETLVEERPYLVNPGLFPNTVMNCATGQTAIRYGLRGINSTIAGGRLAFCGVLAAASRSLALGSLDGLLAGAVEEYSEQRDWQSRLAAADEAVAPTGEGCAVFALERPGDALAAGRHIDALVESVSLGFVPGGDGDARFAGALARRIDRALEQAAADPGEIAFAASCAACVRRAPAIAAEALATALDDREPQPLALTSTIGDCGAATCALQLAALVSIHRDTPALDGACSLLFGWTPEGAVGAVVVRGFSRPPAGAPPA